MQMAVLLAYGFVAAIGLLIAYVLSRAPELRPLRLSQLILVPAAMVCAVYLLPKRGGMSGLADVGNLLQYLAVAGFLALLLAPNLAHYCGVVFCNFLDPMDWTPLDEAIALRPIQKLIDRDQYHEALEELERLLQKHQPTYEALLLKTKLLYHFGSVQETEAVLLRMIGLSKTTEQQLSVMEALAALDARRESPPGPIAGGIRRIRIEHELVLFRSGPRDLATHREIPDGEYEVEEMFEGGRVWLKLAGEDWGNARICWDAIQEPTEGKSERRVRNLVAPVARMHQAVTSLLTATPRRQTQAQARTLLKEANHFIRQEQWMEALPILEQAARCDPDYYEAAYRLLQAARRVGNRETAARLLREACWSRAAGARMKNSCW